MIASECNCLSLRQASRRVSQAYDRALAPCGLRATQYSLLATLDGTGPLGMGALAEALAMDRATLGHNLRPLMARGLVEMVAGADRRSRVVALSAGGRALLAEAQPLWQGAQAALAEAVGVQGTQLLAGLRTALHLVAAAVPRG
jgi:DNA-binding MarR family transcriptional regulator